MLRPIDRSSDLQAAEVAQPHCVHLPFSTHSNSSIELQKKEAPICGALSLVPVGLTFGEPKAQQSVGARRALISQHEDVVNLVRHHRGIKPQAALVRHRARYRNWSAFVRRCRGRFATVCSAQCLNRVKGRPRGRLHDRCTPDSCRLDRAKIGLKHCGKKHLRWLLARRVEDGSLRGSASDRKINVNLILR